MLWQFPHRFPSSSEALTAAHTQKALFPSTPSQCVVNSLLSSADMSGQWPCACALTFWAHIFHTEPLFDNFLFSTPSHGQIRRIVVSCGFSWENMAAFLATVVRSQSQGSGCHVSHVLPRPMSAATTNGQVVSPLVVGALASQHFLSEKIMSTKIRKHAMHYWWFIYY